MLAQWGRLDFNCSNSLNITVTAEFLIGHPLMSERNSLRQVALEGFLLLRIAEKGDLHLILLAADISREVFISGKMYHKWLAVFGTKYSWTIDTRKLDFSPKSTLQGLEYCYHLRNVRNAIIVLPDLRGSSQTVRSLATPRILPRRISHWIMPVSSTRILVESFI